MGAEVVILHSCNIFGHQFSYRRIIPDGLDRRGDVHRSRCQSQAVGALYIICVGSAVGPGLLVLLPTTLSAYPVSLALARADKPNGRALAQRHIDGTVLPCILVRAQAQQDYQIRECPPPVRRADLVRLLNDIFVQVRTC